MAKTPFEISAHAAFWLRRDKRLRVLVIHGESFDDPTHAPLPAILWHDNDNTPEAA